MIGISMRRMRWHYPDGQPEVRDGLDVAWWRFLQMCNPPVVCVPLPNSAPAIATMLATMPFTGFILTGGDDWGVFPERDEAETAILDFALKERLPLMGICRGAQIINTRLGGSLLKIPEHVRTRHEIYPRSGKTRIVNSYHNHGIDRLGHNLACVAVDGQGHMEAYRSHDGLLQGIMWHPEREAAPDSLDVKLFEQMFHRTQQ